MYTLDIIIIIVVVVVVVIKFGRHADNTRQKYS
jgi:hypothetical protein